MLLRSFEILTSNQYYDHFSERRCGQNEGKGKKIWRDKQETIQWQSGREMEGKENRRLGWGMRLTG